MKHLIAHLAFAILTCSFFPSLAAMEPRRGAGVLLPNPHPTDCVGLKAWKGCLLHTQRGADTSGSQAEELAADPRITQTQRNFITLACSHGYHFSCLQAYLEEGNLLACPYCAVFINPVWAHQQKLLTEELLVTCMRALHRDTENCLVFEEVVDGLLGLTLSNDTRSALTALGQPDIGASLDDTGESELTEHLIRAASYTLAWCRTKKYQKILQTYPDKTVQALRDWAEHPNYGTSALCILSCIWRAQSRTAEPDDRIVQVALNVLASPAGLDDVLVHNALIILSDASRHNKTTAQTLMPQALPILERELNGHTKESRELAAEALANLVDYELVEALSVDTLAQLERILLGREAVDCVCPILTHYFKHPTHPYEPSSAFLENAVAVLTDAVSEKDIKAVTAIFRLFRMARFNFDSIELHSAVLQHTCATINNPATTDSCLYEALLLLDDYSSRRNTPFKPGTELFARVRAIALDQTMHPLPRSAALLIVTFLCSTFPDDYQLPSEIIDALTELFAQDTTNNLALIFALENIFLLKRQSPESTLPTDGLLALALPLATKFLQTNTFKAQKERAMSSCFSLLAEGALHVPDFTLPPDLYAAAIKYFCDKEMGKHLRSAASALIIRYLEREPMAEIPEELGAVAPAIASDKDAFIIKRYNALWLLSILAQRNALPRGVDWQPIKAAAEELLAAPVPETPVRYRDEALEKIRELLAKLP